MNIFGWFTDPTNWTGSDGIPTQIGYHLLYSAIALLAALAIAVPLGIVIGYTGRGEALVAGFANALRALPSLGLLVLLFLIISPVVAREARLRPADHRCARPAGGSTDPHRNVCRHSERRPGRRGRGPRNGLHQAADPAAGSTSVCLAPHDLRGQKLDTANRFDGHHCRISRPAGSRPVHSRRPSAGQLQPKWQAAPSLSPSSRCSRVHLRLARPDHRVARPAAHRVEIHAHPSPRPSPSRPPPRCRPAPTITSGESS